MAIGPVVTNALAAFEARHRFLHDVDLAQPLLTRASMSKLLRGIAAGWGAKKLGGGCLSTILVFVLLWYLLGHFQIFR